MRMAGIALKVLGGLLIAFGSIWALQGLGLLDWPAQSVMLARPQWALYGGLAAIAGIGMIGLGARAGRG